MGKHKEWRKIAKKIRRKKIRSELAKQRDEIEMEEERKRKMSPTYEKRVAEEKSILIAAQEAEMQELEEKLRKWQEEEDRVREETILREALLKELKEKNEKAKIDKIEGEKQMMEAEVEKKKRVADCLEHFASGTLDVLPDDMIVPIETQPGKEKCLFFSKVAACKFWDACSRNHVRPAVSKVLLFPGFYTHFSMSLSVQPEYDTDMSLEFDEKETYSHFEEFYRDIRSEFEKYGHLTNLVVCCNREIHLRGNVYASYSTEREAMTAFLKLNGRYYAGRVISCYFVDIPSWKSAICGLYFKQKCPKGNACNFLHVFKDPGPPFYRVNEDRSGSSDEWRWSVSPENERSNDHERKGNDKKRYRKVEERSRRMQRSRSRSPDYRRSRSSERRGLTSYNHKASRMKEFRDSCVKNPNEERRKPLDRNGRSHSKDRSRSHTSDKRHTYRDKDGRKLKAKKTRTNRRSRSRSLSRDNKRKRGEESMHRRSTNKNGSKYRERSKSRSRSSSSTSSGDDTSSAKQSVNNHN